MFFRKGLRITAAVAAVSLVAAGVFMALSVSDGYREGERKYRCWEETYTVDRQVYGQDRQKKESSSTGKTEKPECSGICQFSEYTELPENVPDRLTVDFEGLRKINADVVGWICLPAANISYPIVQSGDNEYYLHRAFDREYLFAGSIFLDEDNDSDFEDDNSIIYGHNMRDGSMFARLKEYQKEDVCGSCPYFWIYTPCRDYLYQIYSVCITSDRSDAYEKEFPDSDFYREWIRQQKDHSVIKTSAELLNPGKTVTLSTCTSGAQERQIVQGICVWKADL